MRKFVSLLLIAAMTASILVGCSKDTTGKENGNNQDTEIDTEVTSEKNEENETQTENNEKSEEEIKAEQEAAIEKQKNECQKALDNTKFHVLNVEKVNYEDAYINGYGTYSEDYETATIITLGIEFPPKTYNAYFKGFTIIGETATDKDGKPVPQTWSSTGWTSEDYTFTLFICRIAGDVDVTKTNIAVKGKTEGVIVEKRFDNNGEIKGFKLAKENFALDDNIFGTGNYITKIKGRYYFIDRRYCSSTSWSGGTNGDRSSLTKSFVLIPLEDGLLPSLTKEDFKLIVETEVPNTTATLMVNENGWIEHTSLKCQTTIEVEVIRKVVEKEELDGKYSDEVYSKIDTDIENLLKSVIIQTDDGDGNAVELYMIDRKQEE